MTHTPSPPAAPDSKLGRAWRWARRNWRVTVPGALALGAVGAWLFFGFFGFHLAFIDEEVDEAPPVFAAGPAPSGIEDDALSEELAADMSEAMAEADLPTQVEVDEAMDDMAEPAELVRVDFIDRSHGTVGVAKVLSDGTGRRVLRFEDFETSNGPDLDVYLSSAPVDAPPRDFDDDFVSLGDLKGNVGNQNYEIPESVDLDRYSTVVIWCVRFDVVFGVADLGG